MKRLVYILLIACILSTIIPAYEINADDSEYAVIKFKCINISHPNSPIDVGDIFEVQVIGEKIDDLYGYSCNMVYDPEYMSVTEAVYQSVYSLLDYCLDFDYPSFNISVSDQVYETTVTEDVYLETVSESVYNPFNHFSIYNGLDTFTVNRIYKNYVGTEVNGIALNNLHCASFIELRKGSVQGLDITDSIIASIRFIAEKEGVIPIVPSNHLEDISKGANLIMQMADSSVDGYDKMSYQILLPYQEIIIGEGSHSPEKSYFFKYETSNNNHDNSSNGSKKTDESFRHNEITPINEINLWSGSENSDNEIELKKTLAIVKKQHNDLPRIEFEVDEEEVLDNIRLYQNKDEIEQIVVSIPRIKECDSNNTSVILSLNTIKEIQNSPISVLLRCSTSIGSYQIDLSRMNYNTSIKELGNNIKSEFVKFVIQVSKESIDEIKNENIVDKSLICEGMNVSSYLKYGRNKQIIINPGYWMEYIIPYNTFGEGNYKDITCLIIQNSDVTNIPVKSISINGSYYIRLKTLCSNGILYPAYISSLKKPTIEIDKNSAKYMQDLIQRRVFNGFPDGRVHGNEKLTRSQFIVLISRLFGMTVENKINLPFYDAQIEEWYSTELEQIRQLGWINGYPDGSFKPDNPITAQEMVVIIDRIIKWNDKTEQSNVYEPLKAWSTVKGLSTEFSSLKSIFANGDAHITREQSATILQVLEMILGIN